MVAPRLSPYPENRRRRLRRALRKLVADRDVFLARYPSHQEAARAYQRQHTHLEVEILATFTRRWRKHLRAKAA